MKFSICNDTYADRDCLKAAQHIAETGYSGIEIAPSTVWENPSNISSLQVAKLAHDIQALNLDIIGFHWLLKDTEGLHLTHPDTQYQTRLIHYVTHLAKLCSDMGGKVLVWGSPMMRNLDKSWNRDEAEKRAIDTLNKICQSIVPLSISLALEPLAKWETNFWTTADETYETIKKVDHPNCRLHLDCKAMADESKPLEEIIQTHKEHFIHFHANDPNLLGPGMGELDLQGVGQTLHEIDYQGWVSVETFKSGPGPEKIAESSLSYMKSNF